MVDDDFLFNTYTFSVLIFGAVEIIFYVNKGGAGDGRTEVQRDILTHLSGRYEGGMCPADHLSCAAVADLFTAPVLVTGVLVIGKRWHL